MTSTIEKNAPAHSRRTAPKIAATALALGLIGMVAGLGTWSAFSSTTSNDNNQFASGSVILNDDDGGSTPMWNLSGIDPSTTIPAKCINVTYTGTLPSTVRLYGTTGGTGLADYLNVKVTRGTISTPTSFGDCANFTADATNYKTLGAGVVYNGTLTAYPDDYTNGLVDPTTGTPESWTNPESHAYKFEITLADDNNAQGKSATQTFTWQARH